MLAPRTAPAAAPPRRRRRAVTVTVGTAGALALLLVLAGGPAEDGLRVTYHTSSDWGSGYVGTYRITNTGTETVDGWTLNFMLAPGSTVSTLWGGVLVRAGNRYTVTNLPWNGR